MAHRCGHAIGSVSIPEQVPFLIAIPQAHVRVAAAAVFLVIPLRHEGSSEAHLVADFLDARLEEHGVIARGERTGVMNVHLVHARAMLAIVALDGDAVIAHHAGNAA